MRFEGNNYSDEWVTEAEKRGLLNLRRTPEALAQLTHRASRRRCSRARASSPRPSWRSRYHVRLERYVKDMLIELHTLREMVDTLVLPAAYAYLGTLATARRRRRRVAAGINVQPQVDAANAVSKQIATLQKKRTEIAKIIAKAEGMHDDAAAQAKYLTSTGCDTMAEVREAATRSSSWSATSTGRCRSTGRCCSRCRSACSCRCSACSSAPPATDDFDRRLKSHDGEGSPSNARMLLCRDGGPSMHSTPVVGQSRRSPAVRTASHASGDVASRSAASSFAFRSTPHR